MEIFDYEKEGMFEAEPVYRDPLFYAIVFGREKEKIAASVESMLDDVFLVGEDGQSCNFEQPLGENDVLFVYIDQGYYAKNQWVQGYLKGLASSGAYIFTILIAGVGELSGITTGAFPKEQVQLSKGQKSIKLLADSQQTFTSLVYTVNKFCRLPGMINLEVEDIYTVLKRGQRLMLNSERVSLDEAGEVSDKRTETIKALTKLCCAAFGNALGRADGILFHIGGSDKMSLFDVNEVCCCIEAAAKEDCDMVFGAALDMEGKGDFLELTILISV